MNKFKVIISGGGTGGHLFPALSIANELRHRFPEVDMLFVGADNRMEMERVPAAGYRIIGLPVSGFNRRNPLKNFRVLVRLVKSLRLARKIIRDFKPDIAIGVGGYASGPTLWMASSLSIPVLIQEQNSYAGLTNKLLGKRAAKICVAYGGMEKYFPDDRIVITGNPVRKELELVAEKIVLKQEIVDTKQETFAATIDQFSEAYSYFGLDAGKPVLLILGGSLGARTINNSIQKGLNVLMDEGVQVIWQTGRGVNYELQTFLSVKIKQCVALRSETITNYETTPSRAQSRTCSSYAEAQRSSFPEGEKLRGIWVGEFITRMDYAYAVADLVVSRAGAGTLSELCLLKKATILVPSPNVAEDHQTKNAHALSENNAAILVPDHAAEEQLVMTAIELLKDKKRLQVLSGNIARFAQPDSTKRIVDEVVKLTGYQSNQKADEHK